MTVGDLETELLDLSGRVRELENAVDPDAITSIQEMLAKLLDDNASKPRVFHWDDLGPDEAQEMWTALLAWVQNVLCARYPGADSAMLDCWWQHVEVVDALAASWFAWCGAYRAGDARATDPDDWQSNRLPSLITRLNEAFSSCEYGHTTDHSGSAAMKTVPTDYSTISV